MDSPKKTARIAGLLYLVVVLAGIFSLAYVPSRLIIWDNAAATFNNIKAEETLFRLGIVAGITCYIAFLFLPVVLYRLLKPVNKIHAVAMVLLALVSVPVSLINLAHKFAVLTLIGRPDSQQVAGAGELQSQVMLQLQYYNNGILIASIFWGLWLLPFGYLVFKSRFLPKVLGIFLIAGCFGYIIDFLGSFLFQGWNKTWIAGYINIPGTIGEIGVCLWLLIAGVKNNRGILNTGKTIQEK